MTHKILAILEGIRMDFHGQSQRFSLIQWQPNYFVYQLRYLKLQNELYRCFVQELLE